MTIKLETVLKLPNEVIVTDFAVKKDELCDNCYCAQPLSETMMCFQTVYCD